MPKVLISDSLAEQGVTVLEQAPGIEVINRPGVSPDELLELIADVDGLAIRSGTKVTSDVLAAAKNLRIVGRAGIGVDNVDINAATEHGVVVVNTPEGDRADRLARAPHPPGHGFDEGRQVGEEEVPGRARPSPPA